MLSFGRTGSKIVLLRQGAATGRGARAGKAVSHRGQVVWRGYAAFRSRFGLDCALRAPLRMTWLKRCTLGLKRINIIKRRVRPYNNVIPRERSDRGNLAEAETGVSATNGSYNNYSCSLVLVSVAGDFSTNARNDIVFVWFYSVNHYNNVTRARNDIVFVWFYNVISVKCGSIVT